MLGPLINIRATMLDGAADLPPFIETCVSEKLPWVSLPANHSFEKFPAMEDFPKLIAEFAETAP